MLALFAGASAMALEMPRQAAFMPLLVGVPGMLLCLWQLVLDLRRPADAPADDDKPKKAGAPAPARSEAEVFGWLALFTGAILGFGFLIGGPIIVTAFIRYSSRESWLNAVFAGLGTLAVLYGVFGHLLELSLFEGLAIQALQ